MLLQLVKKDALIAKKYAIIAMIFMFVIPLFILNAAPSAPAFLRLLYTTILGELVLMQAISQEEGRCPKAASLLCTAPYRRRDIVAARYVFFLLLFVYGYAAYTLVTWIADPSGFPNLTSVLGVLLVNTVVFGIYLPIEFKYGLVKAKFIFIIFILLFSLGPSAFQSAEYREDHFSVDRIAGCGEPADGAGERHDFRPFDGDIRSDFFEKRSVTPHKILRLPSVRAGGAVSYKPGLMFDDGPAFAVQSQICLGERGDDGLAAGAGEAHGRLNLRQHAAGGKVAFAAVLLGLVYGHMGHRALRGLAPIERNLIHGGKDDELVRSHQFR